ncbi:twin-arginine translocation signal domain-containing protein [Halococcus sp. PRR34]|uniref:twin-arginine translocation signal domain-containing protein n=1 Tax=Halococcus sp. PRR34 TaxID=3020830 RepID=UPI002360CB41|nr:twin-arginine translocation signal domain-containing protein [Halococcus sp. PRR34]
MERTRRTFMKLAGVTGGLVLGAGPVAAQGSGDNQRFMIDLEEVSRSEIPESVEIVHDLSAIDVLAARGDPESVGGDAATVPDLEMVKHGSAADKSLQGDVAAEAEGGGR